MIATPMIATPCPIALEMSTQFAQPDLQTIVDAIRSLQVIYEHKYFAVPAGGFR